MAPPPPSCTLTMVCVACAGSSSYRSSYGNRGSGSGRDSTAGRPAGRRPTALIRQTPRQATTLVGFHGAVVCVGATPPGDVLHLPGRRQVRHSGAIVETFIAVRHGTLHGPCGTPSHPDRAVRGAWLGSRAPNGTSRAPVGSHSTRHAITRGPMGSACTGPTSTPAVGRRPLAVPPT